MKEVGIGPISQSDALSKPSTVITGNIRGINPGIRYSKIEYLMDLANEKKSFMINLTKTHLSEEIKDEELRMDGWTIVRSDRDSRGGGGAIIYVRENLTISEEYGGSDSMTKFLCCKINDLNLAVISIYRPPDCTTKSFSDCLLKIDSWINKIIEKDINTKILLTGDMNLGFLKEWNNSDIFNFKEWSIGKINNNKNLNIKKQQALILINYTDKWLISQRVSDFTRKDKILDIIFTDYSTEIVDI